MTSNPFPQPAFGCVYPGTFKECWHAGCFNRIPYHNALCPDHWNALSPAFAAAFIRHRDDDRIRPTLVEILNRRGPVPAMPQPIPRYTLTPADIIDLRTNQRARSPDIGVSATPTIRYNGTLDGWELCRGASVLCWTASLDVAGALIRAERFEPGFIERVALNRDVMPDHTILDADARQRTQAARNDAQARQRFEAAQRAENQRRASTPGRDVPDDLDLDSLLDTL